MAVDGFEVIDCHIHPVANPADDIACYGFSSGSPEDQVAALRRAGVDFACGSVLGRRDYTSFAAIRELNDAALSLRDRLKGFYLPGIHVHPAFPEESCREIERCYRAGSRWIGELVGYWMNHDYPVEGMRPILELAGKLGLPVNLHLDDLERLQALCEAAKKTTLVLAHPGDSGACKERVKVMTRCPNLYLDLSGTGIMRLGMLRYAIDQAGAERILLGSDYPICNPAMYVQSVLFEDLSRAEKAAVLGGNFRRLIGMTDESRSNLE